MQKRTNVTLYRVQFAGIFGRNRNVKLAHSELAELGPDQAFVTAESFALSYSRKLGAKRGIVRVEAIEGCEVHQSTDGLGDLHITPIFSGGSEVFNLQIGEVR